MSLIFNDHHLYANEKFLKNVKLQIIFSWKIKKAFHIYGIQMGKNYVELKDLLLVQVGSNLIDLKML